MWGGTKTLKVDVRLISTSNRDVKEAVANKIFRSDLYYRLNVVPIFLPPLRERKEDIIPLAEYFLEKLTSNSKREKKQITEGAKKKLLAHSWPGNVRELANIMERAVVLESSDRISAEHLHLDCLTPISTSNPMLPALPVGITLHELEKLLILATLEQQHQDQERAAEILGISLPMLQQKLHHYHLV